jgi:protein SCO1/2
VATLPHQPAFRLQATDGRLLSTADFRGRVVALSVGYTACPDVCPTTLAELKHAVEALPADRRTRVQVLFATLDPERDSLQILRAYADAFRPRQGLPVLGLRGDPAQTAALVREFQLVADRQPSASMGYTLDHTAGVFLIDGSGRLRGLSPHGQPVEKLAADLERLTRTP